MSDQYSFLDEVFALKDKLEHLEHQDKELTRLRNVKRDLEDRLDEQRTMRTAEVRHYLAEDPFGAQTLNWRWVVDPVMLRNSRNPALLFDEVCEQFRRGLSEIWTEIQA